MKELDGTYLRQSYAAFRILPYKPRVPRDLFLEEDSSEGSISNTDSESGDSASDSAFSD